MNLPQALCLKKDQLSERNWPLLCSNPWSSSDDKTTSFPSNAFSLSEKKKNHRLSEEEAIVASSWRVYYYVVCTMIMGNFSSRHFVFLRLCQYSRRRLTGSPVIDEVATTWRKSLKSGPLGRRSSSRRTYFRLSSDFILGQLYLSFKQHYFSWQSQCLKTTQNVANFCLFKSDLYGNTIWQQAFSFQRFANMDYFLAIFHQLLSTHYTTNVAHFARNVECDFWPIFKTL